jgi:hypothetical protein
MEGKTVRVYRNLRKQMFSVQEKVEGRWKVTAHVPEIALVDVNFIIQHGGRQRALREKRRNVHAFVQGTVVQSVENTPVQLQYNMHMGAFHTRAGQWISAAHRCRLTNGKIWIDYTVMKEGE